MCKKKWCPRCHYLYHTEEERCFSCGKKLVDDVPQTDESVARYSYLVTCQNEFDLALKEGLLTSSDIPTVRTFVPHDVTIEIFAPHSEKHGLDLFVPAKDLAVAQELIKDQSVCE